MPCFLAKLRYNALEVAADEGLTPEVFKASNSWRRRFMRRYQLAIRARARQGQTPPEDAAAAKAKFAGDVRAAIIEHGITTVYNADQTGTSSLHHRTPPMISNYIHVCFSGVLRISTTPNSKHPW
jgi:hypothetical protein